MNTSGNKLISSIRDLDLFGKKLFLRLDLNVPLSDPDAEGHRAVTEDTRIQEALPTIKYAIAKGAKVILASHLGRPDGSKKAEFSLEPVGAHLAKLLDCEITLADDCIGEGIELLAQSLKNGQVLLLENLRFHAGEEKNDPEFYKKLAHFTDIYVTDAFGTAHRKHASTYGLPTTIAEKAMGFLIEKELKFFDQLLEKPESPFFAILGGAKVSDKIKVIDRLLNNLDGVVIGGAMAWAFWEALGKTLPEGAKKPETKDIEIAKILFQKTKKLDLPLLLPDDTNKGFDIGPQSIEKFISFLTKAKTIFWNGPLGQFEKPEFSISTFSVAKAIAEYPAIKVVGGGDTVSAIKQSGVASKFQHLSTGGGAVLEYLEGHGLPGIEILKTYPNKKALV
ncbi:MAG: phosphoglycerate kinase [Bdellovibrio sp.]|nr:phosphoglycerate kinase [Bdellovibrio sp.]